MATDYRRPYLLACELLSKGEISTTILIGYGLKQAAIRVTIAPGQAGKPNLEPGAISDLEVSCLRLIHWRTCAVEQLSKVHMFEGYRRSGTLRLRFHLETADAKFPGVSAGGYDMPGSSENCLLSSHLNFKCIEIVLALFEFCNRGYDELCFTAKVKQ